MQQGGQNKLAVHCFKHQLDYVGDQCPKCEEVREKDLCTDCEQHKASINFSDSPLNAARGWSVRLCRCCYFKQVEIAYNGVVENYKKLKMELEKEPCGN